MMSIELSCAPRRRTSCSRCWSASFGRYSNETVYSPFDDFEQLSAIFGRIAARLVEDEEAELGRAARSRRRRRRRWRALRPSRQPSSIAATDRRCARPDVEVPSPKGLPLLSLPATAPAALWRASYPGPRPINARDADLVSRSRVDDRRVPVDLDAVRPRPRGAAGGLEHDDRRLRQRHRRRTVAEVDRDPVAAAVEGERARRRARPVTGSPSISRRSSISRRNRLQDRSPVRRLVVRRCGARDRPARARGRRLVKPPACEPSHCIGRRQPSRPKRSSGGSASGAVDHPDLLPLVDERRAAEGQQQDRGGAGRSPRPTGVATRGKSWLEVTQATPPAALERSIAAASCSASQSAWSRSKAKTASKYSR